jgi:hypothetical protein
MPAFVSRGVRRRGARSKSLLVAPPGGGSGRRHLTRPRLNGSRRHRLSGRQALHCRPSYRHSGRVRVGLRQHDMARLPALARADPHGTDIEVEVLDGHCRQLAVAAAGQQRCRDQPRKSGGQAFVSRRASSSDRQRRRAASTSRKARTVRQASSLAHFPSRYAWFSAAFRIVSTRFAVERRDERLPGPCPLPDTSAPHRPGP